MDDLCRSRIISNDYVNYIVEFSHIEDVQIQFDTDCINIVDSRHAIVYVPRPAERSAIADLGYSTFPKCYGIEQFDILEASGITALRKIPRYNLTGKDTLISIIDSGIDYRNKAFLKEDGTSKIVSIWDQFIQSDNYPKNTNYGTEYTNEDINRALKSEQPLTIVPSADEIGHGTALASLAAGTPDLQNNFTGIAPDAELIIVKLKEAKQNVRDFYIIPENSVCYQEDDIMMAVKYVYEKALELGKSNIICIGLGSAQGSHDGRGPLSNVLSNVSAISNTVNVLSVGNEGRSAHHFFGTIPRDTGFQIMELNIAPNEPGFTMEIWGEAPNTYTIDVLSPTGESISRIPAGTGNKLVSFNLEETIIEIDYLLVERRSGDQVIVIRFRKPTSGTWRIRVYGSGDVNLNFHSWLPLSAFLTSETTFLTPDPYVTLTTPSSGEGVIAVTAYNHKLGSFFQNASRGFTRTNVIRPDLAAPGVDIICASGANNYISLSGTSIAAAYAAGVVAMIQQWAYETNNFTYLDTFQVKSLLIRGASRYESITYPNRIWGYGSINLYNTFASFFTI